MSGGEEILCQIVGAQPGLSSREIFKWLLDEERALFPSGPAIDRALNQLPTLVHRRERCWYPGPATVAVSSSQVAERPNELARSDSQTELERSLRERLVGRRLIAEVGLDAQLFEVLTEATDHVTARLGQDRFARVYPFTFMTFLVGHGVYGYSKGNFWGTMPVSRIDNAAGPMFEEQCRQAGLEDFVSLVEQDNSTRYVGPMLAHGGIPKYCLDDFFSLVIKDMQRVGASADELLAHWRTRKTAFFNLDKPVGRFLLYGGDLAVDLLDRCLSAIADVNRSGRLPSPQEAGLPPYIVVGLRRHLDEIRSVSSSRLRQSVSVRPELVLDPWSPLGPEVVLPPVRVEGNTTWRLWSARGVEEVSASSFETKHIFLSPAKVWNLELLERGGPTREWSFEAFDTSPAIFFDTRAGHVFSTARSIRGDSVWALAPADAAFSVVDRNGRSTAARVVQELPDLSGSWTGFVVRHLDLRDTSVLTATRQGATTRVRVQPASSRPQVEDQAIARVTTVDGRPVYPALPTLVLPRLEGMEPSGWQIRLSIRGVVQVVQADESLRISLPSLYEPSIIAEALLTVRGPLGIDFRLDFAVVPGLEIQVPDRLLFPGDRHAPVTLRGPRIAVNGGSPGDRVLLDLPTEGPPRARLVVGDDIVDVTVDVPRLVWTTIGSASSAMRYTDRVATVGSHEVLDGTLTGVAVRTGAHDLPLELQLVIGGSPVQSSAKVRSGGLDGRWAFDLAPFRGTLERSHGAVATFILVVGQRPVTVLRLRPSVGVERVEASGRVVADQTLVAVRYVSTSAAKDRVIRFWPLDRPWATAEQEPLPDGNAGAECNVNVSRNVAALPLGRYLVEIEVDDGWTTAVRPAAGASNTVVVLVGDRQERLDQLRSGDALDILERTLLTGHIARRLEPPEFREVAPAALRALQLWALEPDPGLTTPRGLSTVCALVGAEPNELVRAVNSAAAAGLFDTRSSVRLGLLLLRELHPAEPDAIADEDLRLLWSTSPVLAARLDLVADADPDRESRLLEALNWSPTQGRQALITGEPVDQTIASRPTELLRALQAAIDLMPRAELDVDTLVVANFEWLIAASSGECGIEEFFRSWRRRRLLPAAVTDIMESHLAKRRPPAGTVSWGAFPLLTLSAALGVTADQNNHDAYDLLWAATAFAPKLVGRDLVLASALNAGDAKQESR